MRKLTSLLVTGWLLGNFAIFAENSAKQQADYERALRAAIQSLIAKDNESREAELRMMQLQQLLEEKRKQNQQKQSPRMDQIPPGGGGQGGGMGTNASRLLGGRSHTVPGTVPPTRPGPVAAPKLTKDIDELMQKTWEKQQLTPSPDATSEEMARRAFLDILGRIPTLSELTEYGKMSRPEMCRALVNHPEFAENWGHLFGQWLRARPGGEEPGYDDITSETERYFVDRLRDEKFGLDTAARELINPTLTDAQKQLLAFHQQQTDELRRQSPRSRSDFAGDRGDRVPVPFELRRGLMAHAFLIDLRGESVRAEGKASTYDMKPATEQVTQSFLGSRVACAQCHAHQTSKWTQEDYWGLNAALRSASFTYSSAGQLVTNGNNDIEVKYEPDVFVQNAAGATHSVRPQFLGGEKFRPGNDVRKQVADKIAASPLFPRAMINRIWAAMFGRGLNAPYDPDDFLIKEGNRIDNLNFPELMDRLAEDFARDGFRPRPLVEAICNSRAYGRSSRLNESNKAGGAEVYFASMGVKPMTVRQLGLSHSVALGTFERALSPRRSRLPLGGYGDEDDGSPRLQRDTGTGELTRAKFGFPKGNPADERLSMQHVLALVNSPYLAERLWSSDYASEAPSPEATERAFRRLLGRGPTDEEKAQAAKFAAAGLSPDESTEEYFRIFINPTFESRLAESTDDLPPGQRQYRLKLEKAYRESRAALPALLEKHRKGENIRDEVANLFRDTPFSGYLSKGAEKALSGEPTLVDLYWALLNSNEFILNR